MPQTTFTELGVRKLKTPATGQVDYFERLNRGLTLMLRISYGGTKAWRAVTYDRGKPNVRTLGHFPTLSVAKARKAAFAFDPKAATASADAGSFKEVAEKWIKLYVAKKGLRSQSEIERQLQRYVYPQWARTPFYEIRRKTVNELLDRIESQNGAPQADAVLASLRSLMNWHATRDGDYSSPIVKGMRRDQRDASDRERSRILDDGELKAVWNAAEKAGTHGAILRLLLLTAQRREKVASIKWTDVQDGVWVISSEKREKGNAGSLQLPPSALAIITSQPRVDDDPFVFGGFNGWAKCKARLDETLPSMPHWTIHDLRRTSRSLMARAGVPNDIAERVLGHAIQGVEGTYNRHAYLVEKAAALVKLANLIDRIINPEDNVVQFNHSTMG